MSTPQLLLTDRINPKYRQIGKSGMREGMLKRMGMLLRVRWQLTYQKEERKGKKIMSKEQQEKIVELIRAKVELWYNGGGNVAHKVIEYRDNGQDGIMKYQVGFGYPVAIKPSDVSWSDLEEMHFQSFFCRVELE